MKKISAFILSILLIFLMVGCTETYVPEGSSPPVTPEQPSDPSEGTPPASPEVDGFTVTLILQNGGTMPELDGIYAVWTGKTDSYTAPFTESGVATSTEPDGDYKVTLSATPEGYAYDPNVYTANNNQKAVSITLYSITAMNGSGEKSDTGCFKLPSEGTYRFYFTQAEQQLYFTFEPKSRGVYEFASLINATMNEVNVSIYKHAVQFIDPQTEITDVDSLNSGSFTKNFKTRISVPEDELGSVRYYSIKIHTAVAELSTNYVDIQLKKISDYTRPNDWTKVEVPTVADFTLPATGTFRLLAVRYGKTLNQNYVGYTDAKTKEFTPYLGADGYYHYGSVDGPVVYAQLNKDLPFVYDESAGEKNGLCNPMVSKQCGNVMYDYTEFFDAHKAKMQGTLGLVPVTPELKEFLYNLCVSNQYFWDGNGIAETFGWSSDEDSQWLFACGYFS